MAVTALVAAIERRLHAHGIAVPADAFVLGTQRVELIDALQRGLLGFVDAVDWPTFARLSRPLCLHGIDGLRAAVGLSSPVALASGLTAAVVATLGKRQGPWPSSVLFKRLTRPSAGHVVFRSQLLELADGEFRTTPLELNALLRCHTPAAIRAMLLGRLIKGRPDLDRNERQTLVDNATQHLGRLLPEADALRCTLSLLRLTYYRLKYPIVARHVLRRVRVIDFRARQRSASGGLRREYRVPRTED
ncbi:MAG: hypothetical protein ACHQ4J_14435 [Candidatus Binatia bacterium]